MVKCNVAGVDAKFSVAMIAVHALNRQKTTEMRKKCHILYVAYVSCKRATVVYLVDSLLGVHTG